MTEIFLFLIRSFIFKFFEIDKIILKTLFLKMNHTIHESEYGLTQILITNTDETSKQNNLMWAQSS